MTSVHAPFPPEAPELFARLLVDLLGNEETVDIGLRLADTMLSPSGARPPDRNESAAVALFAPKTAALCFDRIWGSAVSRIPEQVAFSGGSDEERRFVAYNFAISVLIAAAKRDSEEIDQVQNEIRKISRPRWRLPWTRRRLEKTVSQLSQSVKTLESKMDDLRETVQELTSATSKYFDWSDIEPTLEMARVARTTATRNIVEALQHHNGITAVPLYDTEFTRDKEYQAGDRSVLVAVFERLPVPVEAALEWPQVLEFRQDRETRLKLTRLLHWLDDGMIGRPHSFVQNEITQRIDDYSQALRKHGIKTTLGSMSAMIDRDVAIASFAAVAGFSQAGHPDWGLIAGGAISVANATLKIAQAVVDYQSHKRESRREIAFVIDAATLIRERPPSAS